MQKRCVFILICVILAFSVLGCASIRSGARQGARDGVSGIILSGSGYGSGYNNENSSSGSSTPDRNYSGETQSMPWPSDSEWGRYGLLGLRQPSGTTVTVAGLYYGQFNVGLINGGKPAFEDLKNQVEGIEGAEMITNINTAEGSMVGYQLRGSSIQITCDFIDGDITIITTK